MIGFYNYSVILTYISIISSVVGMFQALEGNIMISMLCLMICGLCDMFDGTIARKVSRSDEAKKFGIQIDSLCDLVNFGVLPAVIGYAIGLRRWVGMLSIILYILAAVIRLGFFNVDEELRQQETAESRSYYRGLPVTSVSLIIPVSLLLNLIFRLKITLYYPLVLLGCAFAFVLDFKLKKPKKLGLYMLSLIGLILFVLVIIFGRMLCAR